MTSSKPPTYSPTCDSSTSSFTSGEGGSAVMSLSLLNRINSWTSSPVLTTSKTTSPAGTSGVSVIIENSYSVTAIRVDAWA
ncbi:hypothetical protein D3C83_192220 [compost metagenome]